jgi:1-acyl-sn-glycerol-3-phosphate acyltransferase
MSQSRPEPLAATLVRRAVTIPLFAALLVVSVAALPLLLPLALLADAVRDRRWPLTRCVLFFVFYLACEVIGIAVAAWITATSLVRGGDRARERQRYFRLQCWWLGTLFAGVQRLFGLRLEVEGLDGLGPGPLLVFMRHASTADTVLPNVLLSGRKGFVMRYVLKRELLWDPCLDIAGHRLVNVFVRRGSGDAAPEIAAVREMARGIGPGEGVLIYPEGTRFTRAKQERALARIRASGRPERLARAERLRHVLPPRLGGPLALLDACPEADAVFCAHVGFDGVRTMGDLLAGALLGRTVRVALWRVPRAAVPEGDDAREAWLYEQWQHLDDWVGKSREAD